MLHTPLAILTQHSSCALFRTWGRILQKVWRFSKKNEADICQIYQNIITSKIWTFTWELILIKNTFLNELSNTSCWHTVYKCETHILKCCIYIFFLFLTFCSLNCTYFFEFKTKMAMLQVGDWLALIRINEEPGVMDFILYFQIN